MDEYTVEIDELHDDAVVLVVPALCLLVFGRTLDEALKQARASIGFRLRETVERPEAALTLAGESRDAFETGLTAA
jgi:hypothetical protein